MENGSNLANLTPPCSTEAEISVLGAMLQDSNAVLRASEQLTAEDFYHPQHQAIFRVMSEMNQRHMAIDLVTLQVDLSKRGLVEGIGGNQYLLKINQDVPTAANVRSYIEIVREKSILRKLINACKDISQDCYRQDKEL